MLTLTSSKLDFWITANPFILLKLTIMMGLLSGGGLASSRLASRCWGGTEMVMKAKTIYPAVVDICTGLGVGDDSRRGHRKKVQYTQLHREG